MGGHILKSVFLRVLLLSMPVFFFGVFEAKGAQVNGGVRLAITADSPRMFLGQPEYLVFSIQNQMAEEIRFDEWGVNRSLSFSITLPDGKVVQAPQLPRYGGLHTTKYIVLRPGETYAQKVLLDSWYEFPAVGSYLVEIHTDVEFPVPSGVSVQPKALGLRIYVDPKDEAQLRRICGDLARTILSPRELVQKKEDAEIALSYVQDPLAIPSLQQVLDQSKDFDSRWNAVDGLGRIGNDAAVTILIENLMDKDLRLRRIIRDNLKVVQKHTSDAKLKARIEVAIRTEEPELKSVLPMYHSTSLI